MTVDALRTGRQAGYLGGAVAIQIGNNGPITEDQFEALMGEVPDQRLVLFLTLRVPRDYEASNNEIIAAGVAGGPTGASSTGTGRPVATSTGSPTPKGSTSAPSAPRRWRT